MSNRQQTTSHRQLTSNETNGLRAPALGLLAVLLAGVTLLMPSNTGTAAAHPLGNFSVNRLSIIELSDGSAGLTYLVDMAEIPTFQARGALDPDDDGVLSVEEQRAYLDATAPRLLDTLSLAIAGGRVTLDLTAASVELLAGQGGLNTARIAIEAVGVLPEGWREGTSATFEDGNFAGTNGWRQVIVRAADGVEVFETSAPAEDVTQGLTLYPEDLLSSAPAVTTATFRFRAGEGVAAAASSQEASPSAATAADAVARDEANKALGRFASLVATENLTPAVIAVALALSALWGAMHALGPGHGKTVVAAYLVGERGTGRHAVYLGLIVTATHTISVFVLGAIAVFASDFIAADDVYFWLSLASGLLVALLGGGLLVGRVRRLLHSRAVRLPRRLPAFGTSMAMSRPQLVAQGFGASLHVVMPTGASSAHDHGAGHTHSHDHGHSHSHGHVDAHGDGGGHGHSHVPAQPGWRGIVALGVAGGIVPCPTALVVMLGAIALDRAVFGLVMVTAFSAGLAGVLTGIGLLMVYGKRWLAGRRLPISTGVLQRVQLVAPVLSALTIFGLGVVLTSRALL